MANTLKILVSLLKLRFSPRAYPVAATLGLTGLCNSHCTHCFGDYFDAQKRPDQTTGQLLELIDLLIRGGTRVFALSAGEPLLRKDIGLLVDRIKDAGCVCGLDTNGYLLPERLDSIKRLDEVRINVDGNR